MDPTARTGNGFEATPFPDGAEPAGLVAAGFFFGRTRGSATLGRRILIVGAPFEPAGVREFELLVGVVMIHLRRTTRLEDSLACGFRAAESTTSYRFGLLARKEGIRNETSRWDKRVEFGLGDGSVWGRMA